MFASKMTQECEHECEAQMSISDESIYRSIDISSSISIYRIDIVEKISTFSIYPDNIYLSL